MNDGSAPVTAYSPLEGCVWFGGEVGDGKFEADEVATLSAVLLKPLQTASREEATCVAMNTGGMGSQFSRIRAM